MLTATHLLAGQVLETLHRQIWCRVREPVEAVLNLDGNGVVALRIGHDVGLDVEPVNSVSDLLHVFSNAMKNQAGDAGPSPPNIRKIGPPGLYHVLLTYFIQSVNQVTCSVFGQSIAAGRCVSLAG